MEKITPEEREELLITVRYYWEEKGDPTRCFQWTRISEAFPEIKRAWDRYVDARRDFGLLLKSLD